MKDHEPAFPHQWWDTDSCGNRAVRESYPEMSLRDWFAGMALIGTASQEDHRTTNERDPEKLKVWRDNLYLADALYCYKLADAMLIARKEK